jgi:hypothetical protein
MVSPPYEVGDGGGVSALPAHHPDAPRPGHYISRLALWAVGVFGVALAVAIGLPQCGANAGGFLTALPAVGLLVVRLRGRGPLWRVWPVLVVAAVGVVAFAFLDLWTGPSTHYGNMLRRIIESGTGPMRDVLSRKVLMNYWTFRNPLMLDVLIVAVAGALVWIAAGRERLGALSARLPNLVGLLPILGLTALMAVIFNDSGVVAAGLILGAAYFAAAYELGGVMLDEGAAG